MEESIFKKEGAENYAHINHIVKNLRKFKDVEERKINEIKQREAEKAREEEQAKKPRYMFNNSVSFNDPQKTVTTDSQGKAMLVKRV